MQKFEGSEEKERDKEILDVFLIEFSGWVKTFLERKRFEDYF